MYIPSDNQWDDINEIDDFLKKNNHGLFITSTKEEAWPTATILPFWFEWTEDKQLKAYTHIANNNVQRKSLKEGLPCLLHFGLNSSFISSSWYKKENVSTLNYMAVQLEGNIVLQDRANLTKSLKALTDSYEQSLPNGRTFDTLSKPLIDSHLKGITGIEVIIASIKAKKKLSQNRDDQDYKNIVIKLEEIKDIQMAQLLKNQRPKLFEK